MPLNIASPRMDSRPSWDTYFLDIANTVSERATCPRLKVGCVLTYRNRIVSTGYNGAIPKTSHCFDAGCQLVDGHCIRTVHAESNAFMNLNQTHYPVGMVMYTNYKPCELCVLEAHGYMISDDKIRWRYDYPICI